MLKRMSKALWPLGSGQQRCGVCLFEFGLGIRPLEIDIIGSNGYGEIFQAGCQSCMRFIEAFDTFHASFVNAQWWPGRSGERPRLVLEQAQQVFELCVSPDDYLAAIPTFQPCICTGRKVPGSSRDAASLDQAARWLVECRNNHEQCGVKEASFQPTRLLFLGDRVQNTIRLVENEASCPIYAALSHRWSEETQQMRLEQRNLAQRRQDGINLREFPPMMQDAISVLRRLGIFYVWIDCMCIIQDDKDDWEAEAATMAPVYANAELTLAATWCAGSGQSLFRDDSENYNSAFDITERNGVPIFLRPVWPHYMERDAKEGLFVEAEWPLLTRALVYQEQFLSRRMLHFTRHELFWECNKVLDCECSWYGTGENSTRLPVSHHRQSAASKQWSQIIADYSRRSKTFQSDSLPAMAGVAKSFGKQRPDAGKYLCGLWEDQVESCFFWYLSEPARARPDIGRMPSWSWASVTGSVTCWDLSLEGIEFLGSEVSYNGDPYMGNISVAKITLCGSVTLATLYHGQQWVDIQMDATPILGKDDSDIKSEIGEPGFGLKVREQLASFQPDYRLDDPIHRLTYLESGAQVFCLIFGRTTSSRNLPELELEESWVSACCLVVRCVDEDQDLYERVGVCRGAHVGNRLDLEKALNISRRKQLTLI